MKELTALFLFCVLLYGCGPKESPTDLRKEMIIPRPVSVAATRGTFNLTEESEIYVEHDSLLELGQYLSNQLKPATGFELPVTVGSVIPSEGTIYLTAKGDETLAPHGYSLIISQNYIKISAPRMAGVFNGMQTLRQILPPEIESKTVQTILWKIPTGVIRDYPKFLWRGSMLDVARHFFRVEDVKRYIDLISYYKMNVLHLHLSDDQGWRIEIKSWPRLTTDGGKTQVGGGEGGYYTQEQYKEIVEYARQRNITIIPEIDMPGHINAALASYAELNGGLIIPAEGKSQKKKSDDLGTEPKAPKLYTGIEVGFSTLRIDNKFTFKFAEDVIREISEITPGPYFHVGGDEASVTPKADYIAFINRFKKIIQKNNKRMIGWEEIAQANIDEEDIVQHWHAPKLALSASGKMSRVIMSPSKEAYLDMKYDSTTKLGLRWAGYIEVDSAYTWSPLTAVPGIDPDHVLGVEAPLWSETISNMDELEFLLFPRLPGYAEIGWSPDHKRDWNEYRVRLGKHGIRMKAMEIDFYRSPKINWIEVSDSASVKP